MHQDRLLVRWRGSTLTRVEHDGLMRCLHDFVDIRILPHNDGRLAARSRVHGTMLRAAAAATSLPT